MENRDAISAFVIDNLAHINSNITNINNLSHSPPNIKDYSKRVTSKTSNVSS